MSGCILGTAVVQAVVIRTGALEGERSLLVIDLMGLFRQLHSILEPLAGWPYRKKKIFRSSVTTPLREEKKSQISVVLSVSNNKSCRLITIDHH